MFQLIAISFPFYTDDKDWTLATRTARVMANYVGAYIVCLMIVSCYSNIMDQRGELVHIVKQK